MNVYSEKKVNWSYIIQQIEWSIKDKYITHTSLKLSLIWPFTQWDARIRRNLRNIHIGAFCLKAYNTPHFLPFLDQRSGLWTSSWTIRTPNMVLPSRFLASNISALRVPHLGEHFQRRPWAVVLVRASPQGPGERWEFVECCPSRKLRSLVFVWK